MRWFLALVIQGVPVFFTAAKALSLNRTRSLLTTLGIVIGVASVIAMEAIGEGAKARIQQTFAQLGTNMLIVTSGSAHSGGAMGGVGTLPTLTWGDLSAIRSEANAVRRAAPVSQTFAQTSSDETNWKTIVYGTTPDYFDIRNWPIGQGAAFTESDLDAANKVVVLGRTVANKLFGGSSSAVGQAIRIKNIPFEVVGIAASKGQSGFGQDNDDAVFIPISAYRTKVAGSLSDRIAGVIFVESTTSQAAAQAQRQIATLLRDRHRIEREEDDDFSVINLQEFADSMEDSMGTVKTLLASIAAVSLLVGGIGIMNIMLVSVTERTREIGLRMAVGAKPRVVLAQFLIEALALALVGGLIGVILGVGIAVLLARQFGWSLVIQTNIILLSVGFSAGVGVFFGLYPAQKAARLDPIEALRHE
jgi:putative ABC transport system permease protein